MSRIDVMPSIKRNLGFTDLTKVSYKRAIGIADLMTSVRNSYNVNLSPGLILQWHKILMNSFKNINAGQWRKGDEAMQVGSSSYEREIIHFEAPPSSVVEKERNHFVQWFNSDLLSSKDNISKALLKSAITHLYFESIHPFEDGNGRIGRALAEYALSYSLESPVLLSISRVIEKNKNKYYAALKNAQSTLDLTEWIAYFSQVILDAQIDAKHLVEFTVSKAKFFDRYKTHLNERELRVVNRMLEAGPGGFEGGMTARKYIAITKTSKATATRDLRHLSEIGIFSIIGSGRSVRYELKLKDVGTAI